MSQVISMKSALQIIICRVVSQGPGSLSENRAAGADDGASKKCTGVRAGDRGLKEGDRALLFFSQCVSGRNSTNPAI